MIPIMDGSHFYGLALDYTYSNWMEHFTRLKDLILYNQDELPVPKDS